MLFQQFYLLNGKTPLPTPTTLPNPGPLANLSDCWLSNIYITHKNLNQFLFLPREVPAGPILYSGCVKGNGIHKQEDKITLLGIRKLLQKLNVYHLLRWRFWREIFLCTENKNGTGPFLGNVPKQYCIPALRFDFTDGTFRPSIAVVNESKTDYYDADVCLVTGQYSWFSGHTSLPNTQDYLWVAQNSEMTCLGNDTHLYSCQNQTKGLL